MVPMSQMVVMVILFRAAVISVPLVVSVFAIHRLLLSRSRNRLIYALTAAVTLVLMLGNLPYALGIGPARELFLVMTGLSVPGWMVVRAICWRPGGQDYSIGGRLDRLPVSERRLPPELAPELAAEGVPNMDTRLTRTMPPRVAGAQPALKPLLLTHPLPPRLPDPPREADRNAARLVFRHREAGRDAEGEAVLSFVPSRRR